MIAIEGALILYKKDEPKEEPKDERTSRRDVYGTFGNPLGYRTNARHQYVPIRPNSRMLDGNDGDDEE